VAGATKLTEAVAYLRTSSTTNVGSDKDSDKRQRAAIASFAKRARFAIVDEFNDTAVSGADPIETRPGFAALLERIEGNGIRTVIVEDASRFARDLVTQELGLLILIKRGMRVITAAGDDLTDTSDPSRVMMRQIAGAFAQYEKARLVARLKRARDLKRERTGKKVGGRKSHAERNPELVREARRLTRRSPKGKQLSLRQIATELERRGYLNERGVRFSAGSVQSMVR
jgi:DNA invertase Pin-like site-specific DNA recombinase